MLREMADAVARRVHATTLEQRAQLVGDGADGTPTKHVDAIAENAILALMRERDLGWDLLSEEAGFVRMGGERLLVADPIDGTTNCARGLPFYCVSLALGHERVADIDVGLVMNLCTLERYEAVAGQGATYHASPLARTPEGGRVPAEPMKVAAHASPLVATGGGPATSAMGGRNFGASALEMSLVAAGALDGYRYTRPQLRVIDVAAAVLIVREAGGAVVDESGKDFDVDLSLQPRFTLAAGRSHKHARQLLAEVKA